MDIKYDDEIKRLKANRKKVKYTPEQREKLRKDVQKIMKRREEEEKARRRAEMERFYELGLYT